MTRAGYDDPPNWMTEAPCITDLGHTQPVAAKDHPCAGCRHPIVKGTRHDKIVYRDDEVTPPKVITARFHFHCLHGDDPLGDWHGRNE